MNCLRNHCTANDYYSLILVGYISRGISIGISLFDITKRGNNTKALLNGFDLPTCLKLLILSLIVMATALNLMTQAI